MLTTAGWWPNCQRLTIHSLGASNTGQTDEARIVGGWMAILVARNKDKMFNVYCIVGLVLGLHSEI